MKKKIAFISEHASPLALLGGIDNGGQNVYVAELSMQLAQLDYEVDIYTRRDDPELPECLEWKPGVRVIHIEAGPAIYVPKEQLLPYMQDFTNAMRAFILKNNLQYQLIHAHFFMSALVASGIKKMMRIPYVVTFHALGMVRKMHQREADAFPAERIPIERLVVQDADCLIAECPQDRQDLLDHYHASSANIAIVPCGFNPDEFYPVNKQEARERLQLRRHEKVILQLGRMVPRKGVDDVIRATAILQPGIKKLKLIIVGGEADVPDPAATPEIRRLMQVSRECGTAGCVQFAGRKERELLKYYYSAADVFVSVPWYEPFGITPLESMACGTPVVGSDVGGIRYSVVDRLTGFLVPPRDPVSTASMIRQLFDDKGLHNYMRKNGIQRVNKMFTWQKVAASVHDVYEKVLNRALFEDIPMKGHEKSSVYRQRWNADQKYSFQY